MGSRCKDMGTNNICISSGHFYEASSPSMVAIHVSPSGDELYPITYLITYPTTLEPSRRVLAFPYDGRALRFESVVISACMRLLKI